MSDFIPERKSASIAVLLALLGGGLGLHRFYLGQPNRGVAMIGLLAACLGVALLAPRTAGLTLLAPALWVLLDCLTMPGEVRTLNAEAEAEIVMRVHGLSPARARDRHPVS
jgi:TM2 domain-containing membrane protein YozV